MSEAEGKVRIVYEIETEEAQTAQARLDLAVEAFEEQLLSTSQATETYSASLADVATQQTATTEATVAAGLSMQEFRERVSNGVGALGTLSSIMGSDSEIGSVLGRMSQFGQLGMQVGGMWGPEGAATGAIIGAAIPALTGLYDALTPVLPAIESIDAASIAAARSLDELSFSADGAGDRMRQFVNDLSLGGQVTQLQNINAEITETADRIAELRAGGGTPWERLDVPALQERLAQLNQQSLEMRQEADANTGPSRRRASAGGRDRPEFDEARYLSEFRMGLVDEQEARELARIERVAAEEQQWLDARKDAADVANREAEENDRKRLEDQARAAAEMMEREESKRLQIKRRQEADTRMWRGTQESMLDATLGGANAIGGAFANAFGAAIQGQEDFGTAFVKGMKMQLIQFGVGQVAEGAGALLSAVGLAFTNPPAAGAKAVEGAGKIALGVSLGAAGAAISVPSTPSAEDRAPRMGPAANEGPSGGNVVVNMNSPFVTAGTQAELGRGLTRSIGMSQRRFGRAA